MVQERIDCLHGHIRIDSINVQLALLHLCDYFQPIFGHCVVLLTKLLSGETKLKLCPNGGSWCLFFDVYILSLFLFMT